jgi:hypothetical protein
MCTCLLHTGKAVSSGSYDVDTKDDSHRIVEYDCGAWGKIEGVREDTISAG